MEDKNIEIVDRNLVSSSRLENAFEDKKIKLTELTMAEFKNKFQKVAVAVNDIKNSEEDENRKNEEKQSSINEFEINNIKDIIKNEKIEETNSMAPNHPIKLSENMKNAVIDKSQGKILYPEEEIDVSKIEQEEIAAEVERVFHDEQEKNNGASFYNNEDDNHEMEKNEKDKSKFDELVTNAYEKENKNVSFELENNNIDFTGFNPYVSSETIGIGNNIPEETNEEENSFDGTINDNAFDQNFEQVDNDYQSVKSNSEDNFYNTVEVNDLEQLRQALRQEKEKKEALTRQLAEEQIAAEAANKDLQKAEETKITVLNQYKESLERFRRENQELESQSNKVTEETNATNTEIKATMDYVSSLNEMINEIVGKDVVTAEKSTGKIA